MGMDFGDVKKIDSHYQLSNFGVGQRFVPVLFLGVYEDRVVTLINWSDEENDTMRCYNEIVSYKVKENRVSSETFSWEVNGEAMCVVGSEVIVADKNMQLAIYSLTGDIIRTLPCTQITNGISSLCDGGENSVVVCDVDEAKIHRININSGEVMWTSAQIECPYGVTVYGNEWVMVSGRPSEYISVLNIKSGLSRLSIINIHITLLIWKHRF